jgi:hypothetical protein
MNLPAKIGFINASRTFPTWPLISAYYKGGTHWILAPSHILTTNMIHFTTFFALVIGGMEAIQPAAAGVLLAGLSPRIDLVLMKTFQRRQGTAPPTPPQCATICNPVNSVINSVSGANFRVICTYDVCGSLSHARPVNVARPLSKIHTTIVSYALRVRQMLQITLKLRWSSTASILPSMLQR